MVKSVKCTCAAPINYDAPTPLHHGSLVISAVGDDSPALPDRPPCAPPPPRPRLCCAVAAQRSCGVLKGPRLPA